MVMCLYMTVDGLEFGALLIPKVDIAARCLFGFKTVISILLAFQIQHSRGHLCLSFSLVFFFFFLLDHEDVNMVVAFTVYFNLFSSILPIWMQIGETLQAMFIPGD